jgi:uncharacterized protein YifN (PemK superfamily)
MPIRYPVGPGTILLCDYSLGGFRAPEMVKRRPAVVISPRLSHRDGLCTVVPLSSTAPVRELPYVVRIELSQTLPPPFDHPIMWAKCDMLATVGFARLDLFRTGRDQEGKRKYLHPLLPDPDMQRLMAGVLTALGLGHLTTNAEGSHS